MLQVEQENATVQLSIPEKREEKGTWFFTVAVQRIYDNKPITDIQKRYSNFEKLHNDLLQ